MVGGKIKVALLEDSEVVAETFKMFLEEEGFEVIHSKFATEEWLRKLKEEKVRHFLLDVEQEGKPLGLEFADRVKREVKNAVIVMTSGNHEHEQKALEKGHFFMKKPFSLENFKESTKWFKVL